MSAPTRIRWSHVGLNCRDQQRTEDFYVRWFGFRRARVVEADGVRVVFLRGGDVYLELFAANGTAIAPAGDGPQLPGVARHLAFQVDDLDVFLTELDDDVPVSLGPLAFDEFIAGWKTVWLTDPDGVVIEVSQGYTDQTVEELAHFA